MNDDDRPDRPTHSPSRLHIVGRGLPSAQNLADFNTAATKKHRELAHRFVDELFDSEGLNGGHSLWRRLLSAMMEDHERWKNRKIEEKFVLSMAIPLMDMRDAEE